MGHVSSGGPMARDPRRSRLAWFAVGVALAVLLGVFAFAGRSEAQSNNDSMGFLEEEGNPPPGANDPKCRPGEDGRRPFPVVLVHGTFERMNQNWSVLSPRLDQEGYCVYALNYGGRGMGRIGNSAKELDRFVDGVLRITGAEKVQLVGHSQGGMMPRYWIKYLGGAKEVEDLVGLAPSNYGTRLSNATEPGSTAADWGLRGGDPTNNPTACPGCDQQANDSPFIKRLNAGDDTPGPGSFTQIATENDEIIIPYQNCFLRGEERTVNLTLQDYNGGAPVTHQNIYDDPFAQELVLDALANPGPADPERAFSDLTPLGER